MRIALANDHSAVEFKKEIIAWLQEQGHEVLDLGTNEAVSTDYPVWGEKLALAVVNGEAEYGVGICGTGLGISLACNKVKGIRACVCSEPCTAMYSRKHNNCNIICFGARIVGPETAKMILHEFLTTEFEGGRHARRVSEIMEIEGRYL